jgi:hypothetical protein
MSETLPALIDRIVMSQPSDWNVIGGRPSYSDEFHQLQSGNRKWLEIRSHYTVAAFMPDVSITLAWGLPVVDDFREPWANTFPNPHASSHFLDVFYNGALVFRALYVNVDGGRASLPLPLKHYGGAVPLRYSAFISLLDRLDRSSQFPSYFERAGLKSVDAEWPFEQGR